jgi:hypothetical protein
MRLTRTTPTVIVSTIAVSGESIPVHYRVLSAAELRSLQAAAASALRSEHRREPTAEELSPEVIRRALEAAGVAFPGLEWDDADGTVRPLVVADLFSADAPAVSNIIAAEAFRLTQGGGGLDPRP